MEEGGNVERSNTPGTVHSPVKEDGSDAEAGSTPGISHSLVDPQIVHKALPRSDCAALTPTAALDGPCKGSHRNGSLDSIPAPVFASEPDHHHHSQIAFTTSCELENIFEVRSVEFGWLWHCLCVCVCAVSYTHLTLPTRLSV